MRKIYLYIISFLLTFSATAQTGFMAYQSAAVLPSQAANPALGNDTRFVFAVPLLSNIQLELKNTFTLNDMLVKQKNGKSIISMNKFYEKSAAINNSIGTFSLDGSQIAFNIKQNHITMGTQSFNSAAMRFSKDYLGIIAEGNANKPEIRLNKESFYSQNFTATYIGYARKLLRDKLSIGFRLKNIQGLSMLKTTKYDFTIKTDMNSYPLYAIDIQGDMRVEAAGMAGVALDPKLLPDAKRIINANYGILGQGWGMDFGAAYKFTDAFHAELSIINLGYINWDKRYTYQYTVDATKAFQFEGINVPSMGNFEAKKEADRITEEAKTTFTPKQIGITTVSTLPTTFFASAGYDLSKQHQIIALLRGQKLGQVNHLLLGVKYQFAPVKWFQCMAGVSVLNKTNPVVGAGFVLSPGPVQFHFMTDNLIALLQPDKTNYFQSQFGLNIVLKTKKKENALRSRHDFIRRSRFF